MMDDKSTFFPKIMSRPRTAGDGMESVIKTAENTRKPDIKLKRASTDSLLPGRLIQVYATNVTRPEKKKPINSKNPKFVPYEPYPAAVKPIIPQKINKGIKKTQSKNNMDINTLITQMSQMDTKMNEYKPRAKLMSVSDKVVTDKFVTDADSEKESQEKIVMQKKINEMIQENESLKEQLKQQVQVNKELKTMLVASMGEDLETQVQSLNDDKKHLADALLNSAQHLSTHQEQTEWLAGQCEVWRSKFLASSLMVEELANWKKVLNERTESLQHAMKQLLEEKCRARDMMLCTYKNIYSLYERTLQNVAMSHYEDEKNVYNRPIGRLNLSSTVPQTSNVLDLASVTMKLSENVSSSVEKQDVSCLDTLDSSTEAERNAENLMATPLTVGRGNEAPVSALVHHAYTSSGHTPRPIAACVHCNGRVQLL